MDRPLFPVANGLPPRQPRLLEQVRTAIRARHYSYRTEQAYVHEIYAHVLNKGGRGVRIGAWSGGPPWWGCDGGGARYDCGIIPTF